VARQEFPIDMARRHVREAETRVQRQRAIVQSLAVREMPITTAMGLLQEFEATLADHRRQLERFGHEQRLGLRDDRGVVVAMQPALPRAFIEPGDRDWAEPYVSEGRPDSGRAARSDRSSD
jgi:hypothetical protein